MASVILVVNTSTMVISHNCCRLNGFVEPVLHTLQVTTPYLGKGELGAIVEILTAQLLSCDQQTIADIIG